MSDAPKRGPQPAAVKASLSDHELTGLYAEAFEAYDMEDERVRIDSRGRRWSFAPVRCGGANALELTLSCGLDTRADSIAASLLHSDLGKPLIKDTVKALDEALA